MFKRIIFVIIGVVVASGVVALVEALSHQIYPVPEGIAPDNIEAYKDYIFNQMPIGAMLFVVLAHFLGSFAGSFLTAKLSKDKPNTGIIVGAVLMLFGLILAFYLPHPLWMMILDLACYLPAAYLGVKLAKPNK